MQPSVSSEVLVLQPSSVSHPNPFERQTTYMVIDEFFHLRIDQLINHLLLLPREPVRFYHTLSWRSSHPSTRARPAMFPYLHIRQTIQHEHTVIPLLPQLVFLFRGGQAHFDRRINHGIYDPFRPRSLLLGAFAFREGRLVYDHDLSQYLAVVLNRKWGCHPWVIEVLVPVDHSVFWRAFSVAKTYQRDREQCLPMRCGGVEEGVVSNVSDPWSTSSAQTRQFLGVEAQTRGAFATTTHFLRSSSAS